MKAGYWLLLLFTIAIIYILSKNKDKYSSYPSSYYDEGSWNIMPPQIKRCGSTSNFGESYESYEPAPLNMPHEHTGDLCQECIGHCYLKVWANVLKIPKGQQEKEFCINRCNLECTELD